MRTSVRLALTGLSLFLAACTAPGGGGQPSPGTPSLAPSASSATTSAAPSEAPSASAASSAPTVAPAAQGPWLRAWVTQALPPVNVFSLADHLVITSAGVAVETTPIPTPFPGPAVLPMAGRQLTPAGLAKVVARARALGLLGGATDFGSPSMPGAATGHITLTVEGKTVEITGNPQSTMECIKAPCDPAPGSPEAFGAFWRDLGSLDWLGADAAAQRPYEPPVYSVLVGPPPTPDPNLGASVVVWPLATPIAAFGTPVANGTLRCGTVGGGDAVALRGALAEANALTQWTQSQTTSATFGLTVRPLTDGQDACREVFGVG